MDRYLRIVLICAAVGGFGLGALTTPSGSSWLLGGAEGAAQMLGSVILYCAWRAFKGR